MDSEQSPIDLGASIDEGRFAWSKLDKAQREEKGWPDLEKLKRQNDHLWLRHYGRIVVVLTWIFAALYTGAVVTWAAHYLLPVGCHWLGDAQLSKIQTVLFGSGMGAVVAGVVRNQINKAG